MGGMYRTCFISSRLHWNGTRRRTALTVLHPPPPPHRSQEEHDPVGLCTKWAAGYPSREGEQGKSGTAGKGAGRPLLDPPNHLFGEELLYFALSVLL